MSIFKSQCNNKKINGVCLPISKTISKKRVFVLKVMLLLLSNEVKQVNFQVTHYLQAVLSFLNKIHLIFLKSDV